jgi:gamma-glutamylcyclotransferase (GGCT)/AIG2-like uncharacterized protein YtfP
MNYVFVYGTLKRGEANHQILRDATYVTQGYAKGFVLYDLGGCPAMMPGAVVGDRVEQSAMGEIYAIEDEDFDDILCSLDRLEGEGQLYIRVKVNVTTRGSVEPTECISYLFIPTHNNQDRVVKGGWWAGREIW